MVVRRLGIALLVLLVGSRGSATAQSPTFSRFDITTGLALWEPIVSGDFNSDGFFDIIVPSRTVTGVVGVFGIHLLAGRGDGTFASPVLVASPSGVLHLASADLNGDGALDLLFTDGEGIQVLPGNGDGTFRDRVLSPPVFGSRPPVFADVNNDGKLDVIFGTQDGFVAVSLGHGDGSFGGPSLLATADGGRADNVAAGDFNGDGNIDLAASNIGLPDAFAGSTVALFLGRGDGSFQASTEFTVARTPGPLAAADFDGDGNLDVAATSFQLPLVSILAGAGDGTFLPHTDYATAPSSGGIAAADFNGDGRPDLAVCGVVLSIFTALTNGTFGGRIDIPAHSVCNSTAVADFNLDGRPDLALAYAGAGEVVSVFLNTTAADTAAPLITVTASPTALFPANGKTISVAVSGTVTDAGSGVDPASVTFRVLDEYGMVQPTGPISIDGTGHYSVRITLTASRRGDDLDGRAYTIVVQAGDVAGNMGTASTLVIVPHDQRGSKTAR